MLLPYACATPCAMHAMWLDQRINYYNFLKINLTHFQLKRKRLENILDMAKIIAMLAVPADLQLVHVART